MNVFERNEQVIKDQSFFDEVRHNACTKCGSSRVRFSHFRDRVSREEFAISGHCQKCQDQIWDRKFDPFDERS